MITSLQLTDFKNFQDETLRIGPFTVVVGTNASGKSNIRDAFRFLHGVGRGYNLPDTVGGKYGTGGQVEWEPIRGATDEIVRLGRDKFRLKVEMDFANHAGMSYSIGVERKSGINGLFQVVEEELRTGSAAVYTSRPPRPDPVLSQDDDAHLLLRMRKTGFQKKYGDRIAVRHDQPALGQIKEHKRVVRRHKELSEWTRNVLASMRFLDLWPDRMRQGSFPGQTVLGDRGENLATVLKEICEDEDRREALVEWTCELTPMDVVDFQFPTDPTTGRVHLAFEEANARTVSAYAASDGTLRFMAMLAALLGKNPAQLYVFEEIDNGIHPSRLRLLVDLIENRTAEGDIQVVTTTHSPELLSMVSDNTFENLSVVCRSPYTNDSVIRRIAELPNANELRQSQGMARLHNSGWLEDAILFERDQDLAVEQ